MFQGIQRRLDGAGPPVETPVNAAQGVSNADLNQSRSPPPTNDPFMDTAPVGHRFDHSALGLYGDEGHAMYNFGGLQQSGTTNQMCPAHQFETSSSAGYDPHSTPFSEPGSRGHSIPPATPMIVPLTPSIHHGSPPFHHTRLNDVESTQQSLVTNQYQLTKRAECNETMITELQERLGTMATVNTTKSVAGKKNISNMHPGLKLIFFDLCGIDVKNMTRTKRIGLLTKNDPLPNLKYLREDLMGLG
ncbi:hypothetical protein K503DRAFT_785167 [Rhizopogon vinicolor AM-OR11-026]|uniref:Uncharacterized protein n=1 Tax=Rhizopogon vinicolor AM-OR11-026 TaxID=1314800 RepID=A0A1B7MRV9_9AGAM|nr:hypothetical protein K503DRAFT_785167 [Rhizopogon vinicolor AM-OR11-026]